MKKEILAPVGGQQQLIAAVRCGANAVYLGTKGFNARRNAENFDSTDLGDTVRFCHSHGVRVYVTVNTLITDDEFSQLEDTAREVAESGADAVIVQDMAVMELFAKKYPTLPIHASTQCVVHNSDSALFYQDLGVSRIVVARELSLKEIEKIRSKTSVELEAFVHGALCMSVSGGCYLSSLIGGRSGNRGLCAQPCRLDFKCGGSGYALSLKDMSHIRRLRELSDAGVCSFKIEGRMKRPEYVAAAVTACRKALKGEQYDEDQLRAVFSRSGFTDGYITGKRDGTMFGHREKEDVTAADSVFGQLRRLYDKEQPLIGVKMSLEIKEDMPSILTAQCGDVIAETEGQSGIPAEKHPTDTAFAEKFLAKCGGTPFYLEETEVKNNSGLMMPPSAMNSMRREVLEKLENTLGSASPHKETDFSFASQPYSPPENAEIWARFQHISQLWNEPSFDRIILPAKVILENPGLIEKYGDTLTAELPAVLFPEKEEKIRSFLPVLKEMGVGSIWCENSYALNMGKKFGFRLYGGAGLNITNTAALEKYGSEGLSAATVSYELSMGKIDRLGGKIPRGYIVYGSLPVMRVRNCPVRAAVGCEKCKGSSALTDRTGAKFPVLCEDKDFSLILNSVPLHIGGKNQAPTDFKLLYFTTETKDECRKASFEIFEDRECSGPRTGGLYYRVLK